MRKGLRGVQTEETEDERDEDAEGEGEEKLGPTAAASKLSDSGILCTNADRTNQEQETSVDSSNKKQNQH